MPERPFSRPNSPSVRIVPRVVRLDRMSLPVENSVIESTIEVADRQRRWLRRGCWIGCALALAAIVFVLGLPLFARWQLRRHGWDLDPFDSHKPAWIPSWADPWFDPVVVAQLQRRTLRSSDLVLLRQFPQLGLIGLESTDVSDSELETISQLPGLCYLAFDAVKLESTALRHLGTARKLESLNFCNMVLDDADLEHLTTCHHLTSLKLTGTTDDNVRYLARIPRLKGIHFQDCRLTNQGAKQLADRCPELTQLNVQGGSFSDAAIDEFARLSKLDHLFLSDIAITDDGLLKLKSCTKLTWVYFTRTKVTPAGVSEFKKYRPSVSIGLE